MTKADSNVSTVETIEKEVSSPGSWRESLSEEIRGSESLAKFKDISSLANSYLEAEKALSSRVAMPEEGSSDDDWYKFYSKLGLPEDKRYTDNRSAEDEAYIKDYEEMFYSSGISKRQGEQLLKQLYDYSDKLQEQNRQDADKVRSDNLAWLKSNYGEKFDSRMNQMQAALKEYGSKELADMLEDSMYTPALVDMLAKVGSSLKSDSLITGEEKPSISTKDQALKEIKKLEDDSDFMVKLSDKNHIGHEAAVVQMKELHDVAYG